MAKVIYESGLQDFLAEIAKKMTLYAPVYFNRNYSDQAAFKKWTPKSRLALNYPVTILPPKEFLLPPREVLFGFSGDTAEAVKPEAQVLFGLSLEDLEGIQKLDDLMLKPLEDEVYRQRREKTFIIGFDKFSPPVHLNFDLYFQEFESGVFLVTAKSRQGKIWLAGPHFKNRSLNPSKVVKKGDPLLSDPLLGRAIKESADHPIWDELTETCFGCGVCSYVCPLCYCFDVQDEVSIEKPQCGQRCRNWDSCFLSNFAATSNHNFRPQRKDQIYNWYYHKFYRMPKEHGFIGCVDCNRCTVSCPAKISYRRVLSRVLSDYKKRPSK